MQAIVAAIRSNNPGRPIPTHQLSGGSLHAPLRTHTRRANPETVTGGLFFSRLSAGNIGFVLQSNSTVGQHLTAELLSM